MWTVGGRIRGKSSKNRANMEEQTEDQQKEAQQQQQETLLPAIGQPWKVMTDEQIETLKKQIIAYSVISEDLAQTYEVYSAKRHLGTSSYFHPQYDMFQGTSAPKISSRYRWSPTPMQIQILEQIFEQCNGSPGKHKIKEITAELAQHGQISETSVYNWFQNRRARSKRKKPFLSSVPENAGAKAKLEAEIDSKKMKPQRSQSLEFIQTPSLVSEMQMQMQMPLWGSTAHPNTEESARSPPDLGFASFGIGSPSSMRILPIPGNGHVFYATQAPGCLNPLSMLGGYNLF